MRMTWWSLLSMLYDELDRPRLAGGAVVVLRRQRDDVLPPASMLPSSTVIHVPQVSIHVDTNFWCACRSRSRPAPGTACPKIDAVVVLLDEAPAEDRLHLGVAGRRLRLRRAQPLPRLRVPLADERLQEPCAARPAPPSRAMSWISFSLCASISAPLGLAVVSVCRLVASSCCARARRRRPHATQATTTNSTIDNRRGARVIRGLSAGVGAGDGVARVAGAVDVGDQPVDHLRRREHARQPGTGMRAGADEVEPVDLFGLVVKAELRRLRQHRLDGERRALLRRQLVGEVVAA